MKRLSLFGKRCAALFTAAALVLSAMTAALFFASAEAGNLINGGFEDGLTGFETSGKVIATPETKEVHNGTASVFLGAETGAWNNAFFSQKVKLEADTEYEWHFWFKSTNNANKPLAGVRTESGDQLLPSTIKSPGGYIDPSKTEFSDLRAANDAGNWHQGMTTMDWQEYLVAFCTDSTGVAVLTINMFYENRSGYTDDWSVLLKGETPDTYIYNGDFENGTAGFAKDAAGMVFEVIEDPDQPGNHILHATGGEQRGTGSVRQKIAVTPNTQYCWNLRIKQPENTVYEYMKVTVSTLSWRNLETKMSSEGVLYDKWGVKAPNAWGTLHVIFDSGENTELYLSMNFWAPDNHAYTDDWTIAEYTDNVLADPGFEEGIAGFEAEKTTLTQDGTMPKSGKNALKITGQGLASRRVAISPHREYRWRFAVRTEAAGTVGFAVRTAEGETLLPSQATVYTGDGTVSPAEYTEERAEGYHTVASVGAYTTYLITFLSDRYKEVRLTCMTGGETAVFTDDWYLAGDLLTAEESLFNGDFEDGELTTYIGDPYVSFELSEAAHGGQYAAKVVKNDMLGSGNFWQTVKVQPNSDYLWTFWVKFENSATPVGAEPRRNGGGVLHSKIDGDADTVVEPSFAWHRIRFSDYNWHQYRVVVSTGSADTIDLSLLLYASGAVLLTDDWTFEYLAPSNTSRKIIDVDFEKEGMGSHPLSRPAWTVTEEEAHGDSRSIRFFGRDAISGSDLLYLNENRVICDNTLLETNSLYRFSFWYKGTGTLSMANLHFNVYCGGSGYFYNEYFGCEDENWNYVELVFNSENTVNFRFQIAATFLGSSAYKLYVDDILLEKIATGITDGDPDVSAIVCDDTNLIPDGAVTAAPLDSDWNEFEGAKVLDSGDAETGKILSLENGMSVIQKMQLRPYGLYNFAVSYRSKADENGWRAGAVVGLSFDENGGAFRSDALYNTSGSSQFGIRARDYQWTRKGFTFLAPEDGVVYLVINKTSGVVELDDLTLVELTAVPAEPKDMTKVETPQQTVKKTTIWDTEYEFDFDWNNDAAFEAEEEEAFEEEEPAPSVFVPDTEEEPEEVGRSTGKRMLQVKKRSLISKGTPGVPDWLVILIIVGSVVLAAGAGITIVLLVRRRKKKTR